MTATMFYSLGAFMPALQAQFGWSRGDISLAVTIMTVAVFLGGAPVGRLCDRHGAALVGAASLLSYGLLLLALAFGVSRIEQFWIAYFVIAIVGVGSTPIVMIRPIADCFDRNRGLAMGVALTGAGIAGFWVPRLTSAMVEGYGWRAGYLALAVVALAAAPIVWFAFRRTYRRRSLAQESQLNGYTYAEAWRTRQFWLLSAMALAMAAGVAGLVVHLVPMFRDLGALPASAAATASALGLASVAGRLVVGWLLDRLSAALVTLSVLCLAALGALLIWWGGLAFALPAVVLLGLAAGAEIDLMAYLTSRYFGPRAYGAIYGWQYSVFALGYGISPALVGFARDRTGAYDLALLTSAGLIAASGMLAVGLGPYRFGVGDRQA
jgi:predicted MFS family arabinose efflux permease